MPSLFRSVYLALSADALRPVFNGPWKWCKSARSRSVQAALFCAVAFLLLSVESPAQQPLLTHHMREAVLSGRARLIGNLPSTQTMQLDIVLPLSDQAGLDSFLKDLYDPASPSYRHFLSVPEFTARFGPSQTNYDAVVAFARASGLEVVGGTRDGMEVQVMGPVSAIESAFHIALRTYRHPTENRTFYSPDREPTANLPFQLWHISGLDNYSIPHTMLVNRSEDAAAHGISTEDIVSNATTGSGPSASFLGSDMRAAYYGGTALTGAGQVVGLFEYAGTDLADLTTYFTNAGEHNSVPVSLLSVDGTSTSCTCTGSKCKDPGVSPACDDTEQTLDMTQAIGMAPGLSSLVMYIGSTDTAILSALTTDLPLPATIGCSWGWTPADPAALDPYFEKMAAQGQNFFSASGDRSTWSSSNEAWPADDANVVSVGGTDLVTAGAGGAWQSETAWIDSGGGISPDGIAIPAWQQIAGVINSTNRGSSTLRNGPDVAANANFTFYVCADQKGCTANNYGGTSFAAPMWAGYMALVNQQSVIDGESTLGFLNPTIYAQNVTPGYATDFYDIASGTSGSYSAGTGYDLVTGWGSPNGQNLINTLAPTSPYFLLSTSPGSLSIDQGASGTTTITVNGQDGFSGSVSLAASPLPGGVTASFAPNPATGTSLLTLTASSSAVIGTFNLTVSGVSGSLTETAPLSLTVVNPTQITGPSPVNFGSVNVGTTSQTVSLVFTFATAGTFGSKIVLTQGAAGLDFDDAGADTCVANTAYTAGQTCTVNVTLTPVFAGTRYGAAVLEDIFGNTIATGYLLGTGVGPQIIFQPAAQSTLASGFNHPASVAVDSSGDVYLTAVDSNAVYEILAVNGSIPVSPTIRTLGSGFNYPSAVAVDGAGNVYVADDANSEVKELLAINGSVPSSPTINILGSGFHYTVGLTVDGSGNVYVADSGNNAVKEIVAVNGSIPPSPEILSLGSGFAGPQSVAVDGNGNVYVADSGNHVVKEILAVNGSIPASPVIETLGSGFDVPYGVAVDNSGNVYVADPGNNAIKEILAVNGSIPASPTIETLGNGFSFPAGVALDDSDNVYVADDYNSRVVELDFADPPSLSFATTAVGSISTDSPQTVTVENIGNAALTFPIPLSGSDPVISANFTLNSSGASACPLLTGSSSTAGTLAAGASCQLPIGFTPAAAGALTGSLVLTDSNLNAPAPAYATQTIAMSGTGTQATPTITWATPAAITYGTALSATQLDATSTVAGTFTYSPAAGTVPGAGTQTLSVTFAPFDAADYTTATATVTLAVSQATPAITWATPAAITYGTALSATQLDATSTVVGVFVYSPAAGTVLGAGTQTLTTTFTPTDTVDYTTATATVTLTVSQATPNITWATPAAIIYGTALSATQLDATASVPGKFAYTPAAGAVPAVGPQTLSATFTPTDTTDYTTATATVTLTVNPATPAALYSPAPNVGTVLGAGNVLFQWTAGVATKYELELGTTGVGASDLYISGENNALSATVATLPANGVTVFARLYYLIVGVWQHTDYTYVEGGTLTPATLSPPANTVLSASQAFSWSNGAGPSGYELYLGTTGVGSSNLYSSGQTTATSATVTVPTLRAKVYARLFQRINGVWQSADTTYTEGGTITAATLSPAANTVLSASQAFSWANGVGPTEYELYLGTTGVGSYNLYSSGVTTATSETVTLPTYGVKVFARLFQRINGVWQSADTTYNEGGTLVPATLSPAANTVLSASQTFTWAANGPTSYMLYLGTTGVGSNNLYNSGETTATSATLTLPTIAAKVYARLYQQINGAWQYADTTYTEGGTLTPATLSPAANTVLTASQAFSWANGDAATEYMLYLGTTGVGSNNLYNSGQVTVTSETVAVPMYGVKVFARLFQRINNVWQSADTTYTEGGTLVPATLSPAANTVLSASQTFSWAANGPTSYMLYLGTTGVGSSNLYNSGITTATSETVTLPTSGVKVYARLYQQINGVWQSADTTYTERH